MNWELLMQFVRDEKNKVKAHGMAHMLVLVGLQVNAPQPVMDKLMTLRETFYK
jgi:hypothetical protein